MAAFLRDDLPHLFDDQGIDASKYDEKVGRVAGEPAPHALPPCQARAGSGSAGLPAGHQLAMRSCAVACPIGNLTADAATILGRCAQVVFEDPITYYSSIQGYLFNIAFLKKVFQPTFVLHDVRRTGPLELTTRWAAGRRGQPRPAPAPAGGAPGCNGTTCHGWQASVQPPTVPGSLPSSHTPTHLTRTPCRWTMTMGLAFAP